jgi:inositol-phosphate phosphatase/L-galactose 1-phosphate phosphatase
MASHVLEAGQEMALQGKSERPTASLDGFLEAAKEVALEAGRMIREAHEARERGGSEALSHGNVKNNQTFAGERQVDLVTATDKACEDHIIGTLKQRYPTHVFIGEESSATAHGPLLLGDAPTWIIDPLDGTTNFVHGYPLVTVSIGLAVRGELVLGVIYNPILQELASATRGGGATLNGLPVRVGSATGVASALVCNNFGASRAPGVNALNTSRLLALLEDGVRGLRNSGSAAQNMLHVACGRLDAYYEEGFGGPWDVAAGKVIIEEAGGVCASVMGGAFELRAGKGEVLCGNREVVADIARVLKTVPRPETLGRACGGE